MNTLTRLRARGFDVRLVNGAGIGITPIDDLPGEWRDWIVSHRDEVLAELRAEVAANDAHQITEAGPVGLVRQCISCRHDIRSEINPHGGLTRCALRDDAPMRIPGTRWMACSLFVPKSEGCQ